MITSKQRALFFVLCKLHTKKACYALLKEMTGFESLRDTRLTPNQMNLVLSEIETTSPHTHETHQITWGNNQVTLISKDVQAAIDNIKKYLKMTPEAFQDFCLTNTGQFPVIDHQKGMTLLKLLCEKMKNKPKQEVQ